MNLLAPPDIDQLLCLGQERLCIAGGPWLCTGVLSPDEMAPVLKEQCDSEGICTQALRGYRFVGADGHAVFLWTDCPREKIQVGGGSADDC
ncbi:hypothetical protein [Ferrimonas sp. YFM]|uniref:hypothetical protein n=1 Tax=Ferrimonas sp. YFM TaxID=3028878 RepID=UPI0025748267|nr:hypothetical protein [Ferrimonas sp. YFM]BDY04744.1 hypothetical protein F0521_17850 [Ferrimonas sp. YFM]